MKTTTPPAALCLALCLWVTGEAAPLVCLDDQACRVRAAITNNNAGRVVATCRPATTAAPATAAVRIGPHQ